MCRRPSLFLPTWCRSEWMPQDYRILTSAAQHLHPCANLQPAPALRLQANPPMTHISPQPVMTLPLSLVFHREWGGTDSNRPLMERQVR
jgi:hypothetical protein